MTDRDSANEIPGTRRPGAKKATDWSSVETTSIAEIVDLGVAFAMPFLAEARRDTCLRATCTAEGLFRPRDAAATARTNMGTDAVWYSQAFRGPIEGGFTIVLSEHLQSLVNRDGDTPSSNALSRFAETLLSHCVAAVEAILGLRLSRSAANPVAAETATAEDTDGPAFSFALQFWFDSTAAAAALIVTIARNSEAALRRHLTELLEPAGESVAGA